MIRLDGILIVLGCCAVEIAYLLSQIPIMLRVCILIARRESRTSSCKSPRDCLFYNLDPSAFIHLLPFSVLPASPSSVSCTRPHKTHSLVKVEHSASPMRPAQYSMRKIKSPILSSVVKGRRSLLRSILIQRIAGRLLGWFKGSGGQWTWIRRNL